MELELIGRHPQENAKESGYDSGLSKRRKIWRREVNLCVISSGIVVEFVVADLSRNKF